MNPEEILIHQILLRKKLFDKLDSIMDAFNSICSLAITTLKNGNKILVGGNGGSASQASHLAAELIWRFKNYSRRPIPVINLTADTSTITAISNDRGYEHILSVQIEAFGSSGDLFLALSTSGKSSNVINALAVAREKGLSTALLSGVDAPEGAAQVVLKVPSGDVPEIQEAHLLIIHSLCYWIDQELGGQVEKTCNT